MRAARVARARACARGSAIVRSRIATRSSSVSVGQADHVVELQVLDAGPEDQAGAVEDLVVRDGLVDDAAQPIGAGLGRDRDRPLAALAEQADDRLGEIVEAERGRADAVAHLDEPLEDVLDVGVIAERDRHEADAIGVRPRRLGDLEDARRRKRPDGQVVVAGPAEAAEVRAAAHDLDEQPRSELGVGREDAGARRIEPIGRLHGGLADDRRRARCPAAARWPRRGPGRRT